MSDRAAVLPKRGKPKKDRMSEAAVQDNKQTLSDAVARGAPAVLSLPTDRKLRNFKTRFLGETEQGFWVEIPEIAVGLVHDLYSAGKEFGISFQSTHRRLSFIATIVQIDPEFRI